MSSASSGIAALLQPLSSGIISNFAPQHQLPVSHTPQRQLTLRQKGGLVSFYFPESCLPSRPTHYRGCWHVLADAVDGDDNSSRLGRAVTDVSAFSLLSPPTQHRTLTTGFSRLVPLKDEDLIRIRHDHSVNVAVRFLHVTHL